MKFTIERFKQLIMSILVVGVVPLAPSRVHANESDIEEALAHDSLYDLNSLSPQLEEEWKKGRRDLRREVHIDAIGKVTRIGATSYCQFRRIACRSIQCASSRECDIAEGGNFDPPIQSHFTYSRFRH